MIPMRYVLRQCNDQEKIDSFLRQAKVGLLGLADDHQPYVVPLNFVWWNDAIYFHGAEEGRKNKIMYENPGVCFTVCAEYGTIADPVPAKTDTAYMSVMLFGKASPVADLDEATGALQAMLDKYVPGYYNQPLAKQHVNKYRSSYGSAAVVYRIKPDEITAKENPLNPESAFYPGRRVGDD
ncbi:pyridoxamine 5'-phosphate oxidase family protein [Fictibacillus gelatini]|uniref:pyridoxamine 5'-phosphate oxidase family protein n=1 Tax=Fictibacillus gelatini TaxID=225985 RepID=UPI0003F8AF82|nr:pyridoxamine 5'-phosphate oxidase family protein [Fictibacillus gelatini]